MNERVGSAAVAFAEPLAVSGAPAPGSEAPIIIVGGGPSGIRVAQELARRGRECVVFNAERWQPYNRVKLTPLLSGDVQLGQVVQPLTFPGRGKVALYSGHSIIDIDRSARTVTSSIGRVWSYSKLVLCTGSRAHVPSVPGTTLSGVYTFRNFDDVEKLIARSFRSRGTVIIGGGLLGLEAARGMANRGVPTTIVEHEAHLLARQLDARAGELLARDIRAMGLTVRTGATVARILGTDRVEGLELKGGEIVPCDSVIFCTGIRANMELAREVGLAVGRGIKVAATMQTSDPNIYAVGECAEFEGRITGLVGPGFEQAAVAVAHLCGETVSYGGSVPATKLKVIGADVFSMGDVEQSDARKDVETISFEAEDGKVYRKLVIANGRLLGAMALGDWPELNRLQEAVRLRKRLWPWQRLRFRHKGEVWPKREPASVREWPRAATVCNCTGVTRGQIGDAIALGCASLSDVRRDTGANTVCGSCRPLIEELLGAPPKREPVALWRPIAVLSFIAAVLCLLVLAAPRWPLAASIDARSIVDRLWLDGTYKQVSGYTLLALAVIAAALSLRKRIPGLGFGSFAAWRTVHAGIGAAALAAVFAHTGFRLGSNLNMWLMLCFAGLALAGAIAGIATAMEHKPALSPRAAARLRATAFWVHLVAFWPLPVLLSVHVLSVYFF